MLYNMFSVFQKLWPGLYQMPSDVHSILKRSAETLHTKRLMGAGYINPAELPVPITSITSDLQSLWGPWNPILHQITKSRGPSYSKLSI